jgi:hypothetical protein
MSSLMIIQEYDRLTFASDTAHCEGNERELYRCYGDKVNKVQKVGKDMVFISGMTECIEPTRRDIGLFINKTKHINVELLRQYLNRNYPREKCKYSSLGLNDIGVTVLSVINGRSIVYDLNQTLDYNPMISLGELEKMKLWVVGFNNSLIHKNAQSYLSSIANNQYRQIETFYNVYQKSYSEGVGGYIQVYEMDNENCNFIQERNLNERNLKYSFKRVEDIPDEMMRQYSAHITSATMTGGTINGTVINSETNNSSTRINGGVLTAAGSEVTGANTTKIEEGKIITSYINVEQTGDTGNVGIIPGSILVSGVVAGAVRQTSIAPALISTPQLNCGSLYINSVAPSLEGHQHSILHYGGVAKVTAFENNFRPHSSSGDNNISCGSPSYRWTQVYAATATISTSDRDLKEQEALINEKEKKVAIRIKQLLKTFKYKDAVSKKGDNARIHTGVIAQDVKEAFESEGLDPYSYALFCVDVWYEKDGRACDEEEIPYTVYDEGVKEVTRLGIRYEELLCFMIAAL